MLYSRVTSQVEYLLCKIKGWEKGERKAREKEKSWSHIFQSSIQ